MLFLKQMNTPPPRVHLSRLAPVGEERNCWYVVEMGEERNSWYVVEMGEEGICFRMI
jgi:hypothetical protein